MTDDPIGDYIASLAADANRLRSMHGGRKRWWYNHTPSECKACINHKKTTKVRVRQRKKTVNVNRGKFLPDFKRSPRRHRKVAAA